MFTPSLSIKRTLLTGSVLALLSSKALAHYPTLDCIMLDQNIQCVAGYSDGSVAFNEAVQVLTYDDVLIVTHTTNDDGEVVIIPPKGEYYIVFNPGHEEPAEFDYAEF
ncbi:hypothetical protein ACMUMQ_11635 [Marinomonas sp. 2405UD66-6]|uniref:hypothetical protein n=1 Tax=Marinomonas sp. 2405UD66-6 TaxID=3391834 RepID=UPI0039C92386